MKKKIFTLEQLQSYAPCKQHFLIHDRLIRNIGGELPITRKDVLKYLKAWKRLLKKEDDWSERIAYGLSWVLCRVVSHKAGVNLCYYEEWLYLKWAKEREPYYKPLAFKRPMTSEKYLTKLTNRFVWLIKKPKGFIPPTRS